jgi:hypothetical protein
MYLLGGSCEESDDHTDIFLDAHDWSRRPNTNQNKISVIRRLVHCYERDLYEHTFYNYKENSKEEIEFVMVCNQQRHACNTLIELLDVRYILLYSMLGRNLEKLSSYSNN